MVNQNYCGIMHPTLKAYLSTANENLSGRTPTDDVKNRSVVGGGTTSSLYWGTYESYGFTWVDVGFGDTPETPTDYTLATVNKGTVLTNLSSNRYQPTNRELISVQGTFRNDGADPVTVKEVGLFGRIKVPYAQEGGSPTILLCRKVLDNPLTIAAGETYSFLYRLLLKDN